MFSLVRSYRFIGCAAVMLCALHSVHGAPASSKNPSSKIFVADVEGQSVVNNGERVNELTAKSVFPAQGVTIESKLEARNSLVFSNGTGIFLDSLSQLEVRRFVQQPFVPNRSDNEVEPSISNLNAYLSRGIVAICTSKLVAGSSMMFTTPQASVSIRGRKILIESSETVTKVSLVEGDITIRGGGEIDMGGQSLRSGQQAIIRQGAPGSPAQVQVQDIPSDEQSAIENRITMACMARNTVYFDVSNQLPAAEQVITATPVTPSTPAGSPVSNAIIPLSPAQ